MSPDAALPPIRRMAWAPAERPVDGTGARAAELAALLRGAAARGIRKYDFSEAPVADAAWGLASVAVGAAWPESIVFVAESTEPPPSTMRPAEIVRLRDGAVEAERSSAPSVETVGIRFRDLGAAEAGAVQGIEQGARWVSFPGHLLEAGRVRRLVERTRAAGGHALMTDPHAGGRLDGRWLSAGVLDHPGPPRPMELAELQRQYAPVLPLGFLTSGRRRTLGQAAVAFALTVGAVPAIRFRDVSQLTEFIEPPALESLSPAELSRLENPEGIPPGRPVPDGTPGFK
jgi:hypothetical protein